MQEVKGVIVYALAWCWEDGAEPESSGSEVQSINVLQVSFLMNDALYPEAQKEC